MSAPIVTKSYQVWIDRTPTAPTPDWVEVTFIKAEGALRSDSIPYLDATVTVQMPLLATLPAARYDPRQRTRVKLVASTPAASTLPRCYITQATPLDAAARIYALRIVSEDGRLLEPANPTTDVASWRHHLTLDALLPAVGAAVGITIDPTMPTAGVKCFPAYDKENLIVNPTHAAAGSPWHHGLSTVYTPGDGWADFHTTSIAFEVTPFAIEDRPSVAAGQPYKFGVRVNAPSEWVGKSITLHANWFNEIGAEVQIGGASKYFTLTLGQQDIEFTFTMPQGFTFSSVDFKASLWSGTTTAKLRFLRAWLTESDPGDPSPDVEFFTGATPNSADYEFGWLGYPYKSVSGRWPVTERALEVALQDPGEDHWGLIAPHLAREGWRLLPDRNNPEQWRIIKTATWADYDPAWAYPVNDPLNYLTLNTVTDRDDSGWADAVVLHYTWSSGRGGQQERWERATPYGVTPTKVLRADLDEPWPGPGAAGKYLAFAISQGEITTVTAPVDLWWRPGDYLERPPYVALYSQIINLISFDTDTDLMTLTCTKHSLII